MADVKITLHGSLSPERARSACLRYISTTALGRTPAPAAPKKGGAKNGNN